MSKIFRIFFMWLMLLALPLQGLAQVSMYACHLKGDTQDSVQMNMDHGMHSMGSPDHGHAHASKTLKKKLHSCCNCAPSCAMVLLPAPQTSFGSIQHESLHFLPYSQQPYSADTRRIDRPPKLTAI